MRLWESELRKTSQWLCFHLLQIPAASFHPSGHVAPAELCLTDKNGDLARQFPACTSPNASERPLGRLCGTESRGNAGKLQNVSVTQTLQSTSQGLFNLIKPLSYRLDMKKPLSQQQTKQQFATDRLFWWSLTHSSECGWPGGQRHTYRKSGGPGTGREEFQIVSCLFFSSQHVCLSSHLLHANYRNAHSTSNVGPCLQSWANMRGPKPQRNIWQLR